MVLAFISFQQNKSRGILLFQILANTAFVFHFIFLGAPEGAAMNLISLTRNFVFYQKDRHIKSADNQFWLYMFTAVTIAAGIITWKSWLSLLPTIGMVLSGFALYSKNPRTNRLVFFPSSPLWLIYDILSHSIAGTITEIFSLISLIIAIVRFDILKKGEAA